MLTQHASQNEAGMRSLVGHLLDTTVVFSSSVVSAVYGRGRGLRARLGDVWAEFVTSARALAEMASLAQAEAPGGEEETRGGLSPLAWALIVGGVLLLCVLPVCVIVILALLGPAIGNVFSDITEGI